MAQNYQFFIHYWRLYLSDYENIFSSIILTVSPTAEKIAKTDGITSVAIHIGNSDIVADFVYKDSEQIVDIISAIKKLPNIDRTVWSEEVFVLPVYGENATSPYCKLIEGGT